MHTKVYSKLLLFSLFGTTMWFFGNLYEAIVIAPNLLTDSVQKAHYWQNFITITNPAFFYIPLTPIATILAVVLFFNTPASKYILKRHLKLTSVYGVLALLLGVYIITQINFKLFFGDIEKYSTEIHGLAVLWNILNLLRIALLALAIIHTFKAYIWLQQQPEDAKQ